MKIPVIFQNNDVIVVDKQVGISVHNNEDSAHLLKTLSLQTGVQELFPVHRLDKETSGLQILAFSSGAARKFADEFQKREVSKVYVGILRGLLKIREGIWTQSLTDKAEGRLNPRGNARDRLACETRFRVFQSSNYFTECEFNLITGRQHQIRKHAANINHHLVGDNRYGDSKYNSKIAQTYGTDRMFLHCYRLSILNLNLESPIPSEFKKLFSNSPD